MAQGTHFPDWLVRRDRYLAEMLAHDTVLFEYFEERRRSQPRWGLIDRNAGWEVKLVNWTLLVWLALWIMTSAGIGFWVLSSDMVAGVGGLVFGIAVVILIVRTRKGRGGALPHRFLLLFFGGGFHAPALLDLWQAGVKGSDLVRTAYLGQCALLRRGYVNVAVLCTVPSLVCWLLFGAAPQMALFLSVAFMVLYAVMYRYTFAAGLGVTGSLQLTFFLCRLVDPKAYRKYTKGGLWFMALIGGLSGVTMITVMGPGGAYTEGIMLAVTVNLMLVALLYVVLHNWLVRRARTRFEELYARSDELFEEFVRRFILMEEAAAPEPAGGPDRGGKLAPTGT